MKTFIKELELNEFGMSMVTGFMKIVSTQLSTMHIEKNNSVLSELRDVSTDKTAQWKEGRIFKM